MGPFAPTWERRLAIGALLTVILPILSILGISIVLVWTPLSIADRALLCGCAAAAVLIAVLIYKAKMRDSLLRVLLYAAPLDVGMYAFTHTIAVPLGCLSGRLLVYALSCIPTAGSSGTATRN